MCRHDVLNKSTGLAAECLLLPHVRQQSSLLVSASTQRTNKRPMLGLHVWACFPSAKLPVVPLLSCFLSYLSRYLPRRNNNYTMSRRVFHNQQKKSSFPVSYFVFVHHRHPCVIAQQARTAWWALDPSCTCPALCGPRTEAIKCGFSSFWTRLEVCGRLFFWPIFCVRVQQ